MGFKKVDCVKELEDRCKEDKEIAKYVEEFNEEYDKKVMRNIKIGLKDVKGKEIRLGDTVMLNDNEDDLAKVSFGEFGVRNLETEEIVDYVTGFYLKTIETDVMSTIEPFCWDIQINRTIIQNTNLKVRKI